MLLVLRVLLMVWKWLVYLVVIKCTLIFLLAGTFDVQHCDVHTDHTSYILVECTFAINSTAPGFVLIQDEHSQYTINTTLQRHEGDVSKGSVNITDLPTGEYRVTMYDQIDDILPAYDKLVQVSVIDLNPSTTSPVSPMSVTGNILVLSASGHG